MSETVHLFFNGQDVAFPASNDWEKFKNPDTVRMFLTCAESWRRNGWNVERFSTLEGNFEQTPFSGRCVEQFDWYPAEFWQFIAKARTVAEDPDRFYFFATMDVLNYGVSPPDLAAVLAAAPKATAGIYFQNTPFSMAFLAVKRAWLDEAERILTDYDSGKLALIRGNYISDEHILRVFHATLQRPLMAFACDLDAANFPLLHFARSNLARLYQAFPLSGSPERYTITGTDA